MNVTKKDNQRSQIVTYVVTAVAQTPPGVPVALLINTSQTVGRLRRRLEPPRDTHVVGVPPGPSRPYCTATQYT